MLVLRRWGSQLDAERTAKATAAEIHMGLITNQSQSAVHVQI